MSEEAGMLPSVRSSIRLGQRSYMSTWMLRGAQRYAAVATAIEDEHVNDWGDPHVLEHMDNVISAVLNAAMFLEAMANELYTDAADGHGLTGDGYLAPLDERTVALMAEWWELSGKGFDKTLNKYQLLLTFGDQPKLDKGAEPWQSAETLMRLRNAIVHFKPETIYSDEQHVLQKLVHGKFAANRMASPGSHWWPNGLLSEGCAWWAVESATALADEVSRRLNISPNYQRVLSPRA